MYDTEMLVCLGGILGSGARVLANELALKYGLHHYDMDRMKIRSFPINKKGDLTVWQPRSAQERMHVYRTALDEFPRLAKMYPDAIVDEAFLREVTREYFLSRAKAFYDPVIFIWIEADQARVIKNLERMCDQGILPSLEKGLQRRKRVERLVQEPSSAVPRFRYTTTPEQAASVLWELIQERATR